MKKIKHITKLVKWIRILEHINNAFPEEKRPMMYKMMKWWGGKPHNIWSEYIEKYSKKGDVVLDPFCGRGVAVTESVKLGRKAIGIDLNPIAIFQTKMISTYLDIDAFKDEWGNLKQELCKIEDNSGLFKTKCIECGNKARMNTVNREHDTPYKVFYGCVCSKKALGKEPDKDDLQMIKNSNSIKITKPYPKDKFPNSQASSIAIQQYGNSYDQLFTKRNLYALSHIFDKINNISDNELRSAFQFAFISMVHLASKMPSVRENSNRNTSGSWGRPGFIKVKKRMELNPFLLFERAIEGNQGVIKGKTSSNERLGGKVRFANNQKELVGDKNVFLSQKDTLELTDIVQKNSVDYVITDPPYGGLIPYFDLSAIWSVWLKLENSTFAMPFEDEITIDKKRMVDFDEYHRRMGIAFSQIHQVLKEGKYMTVTFHNDQPIIFNSILRACQDNGFILEKILFQMNRRAGETGVSSPWGTSVSDFYIRFQKPVATQRMKKMEDFTDIKFENIVKRMAKEIICERGESTEISAMIPHIYKDMATSGMRINFSGDDQISSILKHSSDFIEIADGRWWLSEEAKKQSHIQLPLTDRVEDSVIGLLNQNKKVSYDAILKQIFTKFQNSLTPNTENIKDYLKEYGEQTSDGKWKLKLGLDNKTLIKNHTKIEIILCTMGVQFGYDVWSPDRNLSKDMQKLCINFDLDIKNSDRIKKIDVLWLKDCIIKHAFEVENSTSITSALERGSNIKDAKVIKMIVIPDDRLDFFNRKMKEPLFQDYFQKDQWMILLYNKLTEFSSKQNKTESSFLDLIHKTNINN